MKKAFVVIAAILMSTSLFSRPTGLNVGAGYSMDFVKLSIGTERSSEILFGPYIEVGYNLTFTPVVGMYFGARYNFDLQVDGNVVDGVQKGGITYLSNLSAPIQLSINIPAGESSLFINVGPTLDYWLGYKSMMVTTSAAEPVSVIDHLDNAFYNRFNVYLGGTIGVNIKNHVKVYGAFDQSLINYMKPSACKRSVGLLRIGAAYVF